MKCVCLHVPCSRWYEKRRALYTGSISIPHLLEKYIDGDAVLEVSDRNIPILWPWDSLHWRDSTGLLGCWIADSPNCCEEKGLETVTSFLGTEF